MERKLASIQKILNISPIEGADAIEVATVNSWKVVVKKGEFKVNDFVVYCEIDSLLPIKEEYEFLRKSSYKKQVDGTEGFRLRTIKLRGQVSQGLILPTSVIEDYLYFLLEGDDVSERLGIIKYDPAIPAELSGLMKGNFPSFLNKTDEERIQNLTRWYNNYRDNHDFVATEKLDGSSATFYYNNGEFGVCSRNIDLLETEGNTFWKAARDMKLEEKMKIFNINIALQGELIGEGIQGNPYKIKGHKVMFFNAFDIDKQEYYDFDSFRRIIELDFNLETVPVIYQNMVLPETIDELVKMAEGKSQLNKDTEREGLVFRTQDDIKPRISFKAISNKFLLNEK